MPTVATPPELEINDLACVRGDRLLFRNIDLAMSGGDVVRVSGPNGCGKTSLLRIVCGLAPAEAGTVRWHAEPARKAENFKEQCAYVGHRDALKAEFSARENLGLYARMAGRDARRVDRALEKMGLDDCRDIPAGQMSAGQRRRTTLARLLLAARRLWMLDEPLTALDDQGRRTVEALMDGHREAGGMILFTSHQPVHHPALASQCRELPLAA